MGKQVAARFFQKKTGFTSDQRLQIQIQIQIQKAVVSDG